MKTFVNAAALAGALIVVFATVSADLNAADIDKTVREHQAAVTDLSANASAVTYWVSESDGWHVVTTVNTLIREHGNAEHHAVVRFSSVLLPGQSQLISVPFAIGEQQQVLRIRRLGDQIEVARVPGSSVWRRPGKAGKPPHSVG